MARLAPCFLAACFLAGAQTSIETRIDSETLPSGGLMQIKLGLTTGFPIVVGGGSFEMPPSFEGFEGASLFSPGGDAYGVAWLQNTRFRASIVSPLGSLGTQLDYPFLVVASKIKPGLPLGAQYTIRLDSTSFFQAPGGSNYLDIAPKPGVLTIGGSVSVTNVIPGGGIVPQGNVIRVLGTGFDADTRVDVNEAALNSLQVISPTELQFTLTTSVEMSGRRLRLRNKDNSEVTYYSYLRAVPQGSSTRALLNAAHPMFLPQPVSSAGLTPAAAPANGFVAVALQNSGSAAAAVLLQLISSAGVGLATANANLPGGTRYARTLDELFNTSVPAGAAVRITSTSPVHVLGLRGDEANQTLSAFAAGVAPPPPTPGEELTAAPASLTFDYQIGGSVPAQKSVSLGSTGAAISYSASSNANWLTASPSSSQTPISLNLSVNPVGLGAGQYAGRITVTPSSGTAVARNIDVTLTVTAAAPPPPPPLTTTGLYFVRVRPCRLADTRENLGDFGKPALTGGVPRSFVIPQAPCGIPSNAKAYSLNVTVVPKGPLGYITIWPSGQNQPFVSTLNSVDGRVKANAAIVPAGVNGAVSVMATDPTELILDINGYFIEPGVTPSALAYYPLRPCRISDTRANSGSPIAAGATRNFSVLSANCGVPASAQAYALNVTVVPSGPLGYISMWPAGEPQPFVSTLNAPTGTIVANAAIVPAGINGEVSVFAQGATHAVLDLNGYFGPAGAANAQRFFPTTPCRILDTREGAGLLGGPVIEQSQVRSYPVSAAPCGLPSSAKAYSLNATVVPSTVLAYLTLWPSGEGQPFVSTLNANDDRIVANAAIVPAGTAGEVASYVTDRTHLVIDSNGYFAP